MTDNAVELDEHRGMAAQKLTEIRRRLRLSEKHKNGQTIDLFALDPSMMQGHLISTETSDRLSDRPDHHPTRNREGRLA